MGRGQPRLHSSVLDLNALPLPDLFHALTVDGLFRRTLEIARSEDLGAAGDITTDSIIPEDAIVSATLGARRPGVVAGLAAIPLLLDVFGCTAAATIRRPDGSRCQAGDVLARLEGPLRGILAIERTLLNLIGRLSGVATITDAHVQQVRGTGAVVCDTRKTTPGLRGVEKYAVRCGGGTLHRIGLYDAALYKDNHLAHVPTVGLTQAINRAVRAVRASASPRFVEVEVDSLAQLEAVLACEEGLVDVILLDNMPLQMLREAVEKRNQSGRRVLLEASGGVSLGAIRAIAESGVERVSVGAITHSAPALDVGLDIEPS